MQILFLQEKTCAPEYNWISTWFNEIWGRKFWFCISIWLICIQECIFSPAVKRFESASDEFDSQYASVPFSFTGNASYPSPSSSWLCMTIKISNGDHFFYRAIRKTRGLQVAFQAMKRRRRSRSRSRTPSFSKNWNLWREIQMIDYPLTVSNVTRPNQCDQEWLDVTNVTKCDQMWPGVTNVTRCDQCY